MSVWARHGLPERLDGLSFVDVGCWEGDLCLEAVERGADAVLGIDYCTSPDLTANLSLAKFDFLQMDVFSEKLLQLPEFDIVHSAGVLYHVENPLSFLFRLRKLSRLGGRLYIETTFAVADINEPIMVFHPGKTLDDNPSNWWSPNELCLRAMLSEVGLVDIEVTHVETPSIVPARASIGRMCIHGRVANTPANVSQKVLPRRPSYMPIAGGHGNRRGISR